MSTIQQLLQDIEASPSGPNIAAIFDFDGTIIAGYSATSFIREQVKRGDVTPRQLLEIVSAMASFGLGNLGFSGLMAVNAQFMRGIEEKSYIDAGEELYKKQIARLIYPESRALVEAHIARGHTVAIISSATPYQVEPAAADLDIPHVLCSHLEVSDGKFTGSAVKPLCFGQGKVDAAEKLAGGTGADLDRSFFYSDSTDDLLLLERVGFPRALNPSGKLEKVARERGWPIGRFGSRGRPRIGQYIRSAAATGSLVSSFVAGLPILALTGSRRESQNFSFSLFADTASALIGMDLTLDGEEHLWSHRPAVFIFNHQSKADVIVIAKLLRRDIAGIGKQEIKKETPILGKVLEMGGVVFIDRANAKSAIESMTPLVEAMKNEGKSVVLAPEGTRTVSPRLTAFKKGAFHLAMQAGVPIVPIVIRNAGDVAPKGDFVFRAATVDVQVLPPVQTDDWRVADLDDRVREVRNMFARALGQPEETAAEETATVATATVATATADKKRGTVAKKAGRKNKTGAGDKARRKTGTSTSTKSRAAAKTAAKSKTTAKTRAKTRAKTKSNAKSKPVAKAKTKTKTKAIPGSKTGSQTKSKSKSKSKARVKAKTAVKAKVKKTNAGRATAKKPAARKKSAARATQVKVRSKTRGKARPKNTSRQSRS